MVNIIMDLKFLNLLLFVIVSFIFSFHNLSFATEVQEPLIRDPMLKIDLVTEGLSSPTSMAFLDSDNIIVLEKNTGDVRLVSSGNLLKEPLLNLDIDSTTSTCCRGLLGVTVDNDYIVGETKVFLYYSSASDKYNKQPVLNQVYRYNWINRDLINPILLLDLPATPGPNHPGGKLVLGKDGYLYTAIGDLNNEGLLQNIPGSYLTDSSVIIRINSTNGSAPSDNPFAKLRDVYPDSQIDKYYGYGIRNSFGLDIDPITGYLWETENGDEEFDEINLVLPGFNSGWKKLMGPLAENGIKKDELVLIPGSYYGDPIFTWEESIGVTDIEFFSSSRLGPEYENNIFVGDINYGNLNYFVVNNTRTGIEFDVSKTENKILREDESNDHVLFGTGFKGITDIETGPDGFLYVLTFDQENDGEGKIYRITTDNSIKFN